MRTEKQVKEALKEATKELKKSKKQFDKYDNHDDMEAIAQHEETVRTLGWVLEKS